MVDFEGGKRGGFERDESFNDALLNGSNEYQESPANISAGTRIMVADANGVVHLPAGTTLDDFVVQGRDLVIRLADGSTILIPDGAINTPQIVIDGTLIPPIAVSAALNGLPMSPDDEGFNPDALPNPPSSSGGSFDDGDLFLQDAFDLGNLLPYTELAFEPEPEEEIIPGVLDRDPDIVIITPDNPVGVENAIATVAERGLPARGDEPQGTAEETDAETTTGTIVFSAPDGLSAIILNGVEITTVGQEFVTPFGTLTITSINLSTGEIGFSYTLADNLLGETEDGNFFVTVVDRDGDTANATLKILVEDDSPIAADDIGIVAAGTHTPISGNVLDNDEPGADDYPVGEEGPDAVTGFSNDGGSAQPGDSLQGEYGVLTLNADGSYTYVRDFNTPGGVTDSFTYTIIDQDGSTDSAILTINIEDAPNNIEIPSIGEGTVVSESGLPERGDPLEPEGTDAGSGSDSTGGTITFNSPDGLGSITIDGVEVNLENVTGNDADDQVIIDDETGTLVITAVTYDPVTGDGSITYEYTLSDNTSGDDTSVSFEVVVTDLDGDEATDDLVINIVDDEPEAFDDSATQDSENAPVTVDVFANDIEGADGVALDTIALVEGTLTGAGELTNNGDGTFTYTPAPGEEGTVTFQYSITDGDGDSSTATVTIDLLDDSTPEISTEGGDVVYEAGLDGPPASTFEGSDSDADSEITTGVINISTGGDTIASLVINGVDVTGGGTVAGAYGTLTVTFDGTDYSYSYELGDNITDVDLVDEVDSFSLTVTDSDGDEASTTLDITVIDDVPDAQDDTFNQQAENAPVVGDVSTNDVEGADGALSYAENGDLDGAGTLDFNADGTFTYTPADGEEGTVTFTYTLTDGDGDESIAKVTINLADDSKPMPNDAVAAVDDDGLPGGNPGADAATDLDTDVGDSGAGLGDESVFVGTFTADFGADGPGTFTLAGMDGTSGTVGTESIDYSWDAGTNTLTATINGGDRDGTDLFTVAVDPASGQYTVTLLQNVLHEDDGTNTENEATAVLTFTAIDSEGDEADATLTITFDDDVPTAVDDTDSLTEGGPISTSGNVITDAEANGDNGADAVGADGATVQNAGEIAGVYGTLVLGADGSYTYTLSAFGISQLSTLSDGEFFTEEFDYTLVDGDGDTSTATLTITLNGVDDGVTITGLDGDAPEVVLDEDDLADGSSPDAAALTQSGNFGVISPDGLDDVQVNSVDVVVDGAFVGPVEVANNGIYSVSITGWTPVFAADGVTVISATFDYSATLLDNTLAHDELGQDDIVDMLTVTATDSDGSSDSAVLDVQIIDDVPTANDDTDSTAEGGFTAGNVVLGTGSPDGTAGADVSGADGFGTPTVIGITSVNQGTSDSTADDGFGNFVLAGEFGTLTLNQNGNYIYQSNPDSVLPPGETDVFTYTIVDADGDTSTATLTITIRDVSRQPDNQTKTVFEAALDLVKDGDDLAAGNVEGSQPGLDTETVSGQLNVVGATSYTLISFTGNYGEFQLNADGSYTYTLTDPVDGPDANDGTNTFTGAETIVYQAQDANGNTVQGTITIDVVDDVPTANDDTFNQVSENAPVMGDVSANDVEGADGAASYVYNDDHDGEGTLDFNADGTFTYTPADGEEGTVTFTYTLTDGDGDESTATVTINLQDDSKPTAGTVTARLDDDGLPGGNDPNNADDDLDANTDGNNNDIVFVGTLTGSVGNDGPATFSFAGMDTLTGTAGLETVTYSWDAGSNTLTATVTGGDRDGTPLFTVQITDVNTGAYTVTLLTNFLHDGGDDGELASGVDSLNLTYTVSDSDSPADTANGTLTIEFGDDAPNDFTPVGLTDTSNSTVTTQDDALVNSGFATATRLINDPNNDGIGTNFIGADGFGSLTFTGGTDGVTTLETTGGDPITSGGDTIYLFGFGTDTLIGTTDPTNTDAGAKVFTVTLDAGTGAGDDATYTIDFDQPLDDGAGFVFDDFSSAPAGQNQWIGLDSDGTDINLSQNDSEDLLITGLNGGTVNTSATDIGSNNQWIDNGEGIRIDYVIDVARDPGLNEKNAGGYTFDGHYLVTDSSFTVMQVKGGGTQAAVKISLFNDDDSGNKDVLDGTPVAVDFSSLRVTDANGNDITTLYTDGDLNNGDFVPNGDGTVTVTGLGAGYTVSFEGVSDFNAVEYSHGGGSDFSLGAFGFSSATSGNDLSFSFDVLATDGDGDTSTGTIDITVTPDTSVTPVVLDLDGGGNEFTSLSGGLAYDYNGDGVKTQTAWIAAGSAILAYDLNGDNIVSDASEFVFGGNGMTDLEAIAAKYDDNGDGKLDANDAAYGKFGVWIDADLDAVSDPGEFVSLADAGITSIQLVSNGIPTIEADGDVTVYGTASFTWADGSTGAVSDAAFATGSDVDPAMMEALLALQTSPEPADANLADATGMDQSNEAPKLVAIVDDIMAENAIDAMLDHLAGKDADFVGISGEGRYLGDGALAQMIETGAFAFAGKMTADLHEDAAALATIHA